MAKYAHILFTRVDEQTKQEIALAASGLGVSQAEFIRTAIARELEEYRAYVEAPVTSSPAIDAVRAQAQAGRAPVVGGETLPISTESAVAEGLI